MTSDANPQSNQPGQGQVRQLNLQQMAGQFMAGVQRHLDMLAYNLAGQTTTTEAAFTARAEHPNLRRLVNPLGNFEQLQAFARDLLTRQVIGDGANLAVNCLHNAHLFLALVKATGGAESTSLDRDSQKVAQESQQAFVRTALDQKFNMLEEQYGVMCPLEDTIASCGLAMQAIMQHGGVVQKQHVDESGEMVFELQVAPEGAFEAKEPWFDSVETRRKVFREGGRIYFTDEELQFFLFTIAIFGHQLFTSVTRYAREVREDA